MTRLLAAFREYLLALLQGPGFYKRVGRLWVLKVFGARLTHDGRTYRLRLKGSNA